MIYELIAEKHENGKPTRVYRNSTTNTEVKLQMIYEHETAGKWWGFVDLFKIPIMRMVMARNITDMYNIGLSLKDIQTWCSTGMTLAKSNEPDKYERLYALFLEMQTVAGHTADPIKQQLALCTVYILADDERIDYFDEAAAQAKLEKWKAFPAMVTFFLTWHTSRIQPYIKRLEKISETVLNLQGQAIQKGREQSTSFEQ